MTVSTSALANPNRNAANGDAKSGTQKIAGYNVNSSVLSSIKLASRQTGVDFGYLMAQAAQESSFQPTAQASTSNATGLYQFLKSTWLNMVKQHGADHGLAGLAQKISTGSNGQLTVSDPVTKQQILDLRKDPHVSAVLGAEFALSNKEELEHSLDRKVGPTELYLAHFLGANGATKFLQAIDRNSGQSAASLMPQAAAANKAVFYNPETGQARTVGDVYKMFSRSIESNTKAFASADDGAPVVVQASTSPKAAFAPGLTRRANFVTGTTGSQVDEALASTSGTNKGPTIDLMTLLSLVQLGSANDDKSDDGSKTDNHSTAARAAVNQAYRSNPRTTETY